MGEKTYTREELEVMEREDLIKILLVEQEDCKRERDSFDYLYKELAKCDKKIQALKEVVKNMVTVITEV